MQSGVTVNVTVTHMHGNEDVTNINHGRDVRTMERWLVEADPLNFYRPKQLW